MAEAASAERPRRRTAFSRICRFCLAGCDRADDAPPLTDIFATASAAVPLPLQVMSCVAIEVFPSDGMPSTICNVCRYFIDQSYKFKQICKQADEALRHYVANGELSGPIEWPPDLIERLPDSLKSHDYCTAKDTPPTPIKWAEKKPKAKTPGARPVGRPRKHPKPDETPKKVVQNDTFSAKHMVRPKIEGVEEEEEEEDDDMPTGLKVTQMGDEVIISADDGQGTLEPPDDEDIENKAIPTGLYPCPYCRRSFALQQLRDMHVKTHSRERKYACQQCDRSFFSKYDLHKHDETHSSIKPYKCNACSKSFLRPTLLQRHVKTHTSAIKLLCSQCDQIFLTAEELHLHIERRHSRAKPFSCTQCPKKFSFKQGLERHCSSSHAENYAHKCDYCSESFPTPSKLMRHVKQHAGLRPYPCKFCPKSFLLSHHYTRHLRFKHLKAAKDSETKSKYEGVFARQEDCYKCFQCDKTFCTQDELIFHSAIHATQDLTCPLCKEKFQDVDAVTTHIKSHIAGEQYICEWCELVFTSEEKLDIHIDSKHQELIDVDVYNEINVLERQLTEDSGVMGVEDNSTDEEDELYESTQQAEAEAAALEAEAETLAGSVKIQAVELEDEYEDGVDGMDLNSEKMPEIEVEVTADGDVNVKLDTRMQHQHEDEAEHGISDESAKISYGESNVSRSEEFLAKQTDNNKEADIASKADGTKTTTSDINSVQNSESRNEKSSVKESAPQKLSFIQRMQEQKMKRYINVPQEKTMPEPRPAPRTSEKSLMLLEKDIRDLQKNAKSSPEKPHFSSYKSTLSKREDKEKILKSSRDVMKMKSISSNEDDSNDSSTIKRHKFIKNNSKLTENSSEDSNTDFDSDTSEAKADTRRSTRPGKVKDYAALVRDGTDRKESGSEEIEEERLEDDELEEQEYKPPTSADYYKKKTTRKRGRPKKNTLVPTEAEKKLILHDSRDSPKPVANIPVKSTPKRRGRPSNKELEERAAQLGISLEEYKNNRAKYRVQDSPNCSPIAKSAVTKPDSGDKVLSRTEQMFKKLPPGLVKTLPPGIKPEPLPPGAGVPPGVCQMKIGEKVVRVQKIVMTKAEVDAITKKGLIEMKDGAMVLKPGVKLPTTADNKTIRNTLLNEVNVDKESSATPASSSQESAAKLDSLLADETPKIDAVLTSPKPVSPKPTRFANDSDDDN